MAVPQIIAFVNQKGGVGKSTGAVHAADRFTRKGYSVILVDADGQQSSSQWTTELKESYPKHKLSTLSITNPEDLFDKLPKLAQECDVVIVDGPAKSNEITKAILARCHLALIPCRESIVELRSSNDIVRLIRQVRELRGEFPKAAIYMTQVKSGTVLLKEAQEVLSEDPDIPLLKTIIYDRQVFKDAPGQATTVFGMGGKSAKDAAKLYEALFSEALKLFNDK
jgi:chromosome partitioning protein